jgi:hypothetical protein
MWTARFSAAGVKRSVLEVWHEDGSRRGDEEWEEHLSAQLADANVRWIQINGWATTINWGRVLRPAIKPAVEAFHHAVSRAANGGDSGGGGGSGGSGGGRGGQLRTVVAHGPSWACTSCMIWAMYRPRAVLRSILDASPLGESAPLACLKARTMYAEDKRFFPDSLPPTLSAIDELWASYKGHLGDVTFWGPRDRLRCVNHSAAQKVGRGLIAPSAALACMERVRAALDPQRARLFVAVDAPRLQETIFRQFGHRAFITPGVGVDPTNEYRDEGQRDALKLIKPRGQHGGSQDLSERNLIKVSLDYYIQVPTASRTPLATRHQPSTLTTPPNRSHTPRCVRCLHPSPSTSSTACAAGVLPLVGHPPPFGLLWRRQRAHVCHPWRHLAIGAGQSPPVSRRALRSSRVAKARRSPAARCMPAQPLRHQRL